MSCALPQTGTREKPPTRLAPRVHRHSSYNGEANRGLSGLQGTPRVGSVVRPESWIEPVGASPTRVIAGEPGSRPRFVAERPARGHRTSQPVPQGLGQLLSHRECRTQVPVPRPLRGMATEALARKEAWTQPAPRSGCHLVPHLVPRPGPVHAHGHNPLPGSCVTMSRRPSESRVRENRMHGLKGGWGNRLAPRALRP